MTNDFQRAWVAVAEREGFFSDDPADSGGATKFGISRPLARAHGYTGDMRHLSFEKATQIIHKEFWVPIKGDTLAGVSTAVAEEVLDTAVLMGAWKAARMLQRCLNVLNREEKDFDDLIVDGIIGSQTTVALTQYITVRSSNGVLVLLLALNSLQGAALIELGEARVKDERFIFGWLLNRVALNYGT